MSKFKTVIYLICPGLFTISVSFHTLAATHSCFQNEMPFFLEMQSQLKISENEQFHAVKTSCEEIVKAKEKFQTRATWSQSIFNYLGFFADARYGGMAGAFSFMDSTKAESEYKSEIQKIRTIQNRYERIRLVYELVVRTMGVYDKNLTVLTDWQNSPGGLMVHPANTINRAKATGSGGVCRQHVGLLAWSLMQVARPTGESSMGLTNNSFSASINSTYDDKWTAHTWVRLNLPFETENGLVFENVDIDTTWYKIPTFLNPRMLGLEDNETETIQIRCEEIKKCLSDSIAAKMPRLNIDPMKYYRKLNQGIQDLRQIYQDQK